MYSGNLPTSEPEQFLISPPSLKKLASQEIALELHRFRTHHCRENTKLTGEWFYDSFFEPEDIIDVLPAISKMIKKCIDSVGESISNWCQYHEEYVFFYGNLHNGILSCIDEFVLKPDGNINFRSTAKNIVTSNKLNAINKFAFASLFCLVEDVRNIWPEVCKFPPVIAYVGEKNPLIHYWTEIMFGESPRFPMLTDMKWPSIEYFWNMLSAEQQVTVAKNLLGADEGEMFIETLLLRLNKTQLRRVMEQIDVGKLLSNEFFHGECRCSEMLTVWNYIKYFISPLKFQQILLDCIKKNSTCRDKCTAIFNIWISAEDQVRRCFLNNGKALKSIFQRLNSSNCAIEYSDLLYDMRLFHAVLSELSFQSRNSLWCEFWPNLIIGARLNYLDEIMRLCFNNDNEITQFKEHDLLDFNKIHRFCQLCLSRGFMSELNDYLNYCSSDIHRVAAVKRQILSEKRMQCTFSKRKYLSDGTFIEIDKFIDSAFFNENDARQYKKKLLKSNKELKKTWTKIDKTKLGISWS